LLSGFPAVVMTFVIQRDDGMSDRLTAQSFLSYDAAYEELERYYRDFCCSDDERVEYVIVELNGSA
jgi:hypothetical protein